MLTIFVILALLLQIAIALGLYFRRNGRHANILFMMLVLALAGWSFTNYISVTIPQNTSTIYAIRLILGFVVLQNTLFYFFAHTFPTTQIGHLSRSRKLVLAYSLLAVVVTQTPLLFKSVIIKSGYANPVVGPGMLIFVTHALFTTVAGLRSLSGKYHRATGLSKTQLQLILYACFVTLLIVPITNFVITLAAQTTIFVKVGPFYTLAFGGLITYAIVAQKLFDIRAAVARSVGYLMVVVCMTAVYGVGLFGVIDVLLPGNGHQFMRQVLSVILITPLALVFQRTKEFFDRISNRLFYRDAYDIQDVLDKLGTIAVSEIELYRILRDVRAVLNDALKSSFVEFVLIRNGKPYFEAHTHKVLSQRILALGPTIHEQHRDLLATDSLGQHHPLYEVFHGAGVAVSLKLKSHEQVVGYIVFGDKRSGDVYTPQDKQLLLIAANELAIAFQNALRFEEIENFNLTLQAKVDEATRLLRKNNEKLKQLDESKDDFVSMASHQLRTPLTSVKGYISMVLEGDAGKLNAMQRQLLEQSFESSQRMVYLIADLLNVSRLRTGKFVIEPAPVNLAELVEQEIDQLVKTAAAKRLTLTYHRPHGFPTLMLDETKTRQVIMNFVDNAIYYTPAGGHIEVKLIETPASVEFRVVDDGIGVPKSEVPHLFTKFYRAGNARKARPDGTGLGLFMAKKVIVAEGGALIFETEEGKGSTFGFVFSKTKLAPGAPAAAAPAAERAAK